MVRYSKEPENSTKCEQYQENFVTLDIIVVII